MTRRLLLVPLGLLAAASAGAVTTPSDVTRFVTPRELTSDDIGERWRVFGHVRDYALDNGRTTAVVRRRDGWLVDFWSNRAHLPSSPQLGTATDIDAIWQMFPIVVVGKDAFPANATRVALLDDAVETEGTADAGSVHYRALSRIALDRERARVRITTTWSVDGGAASGPVGLGDSIKWGNTTYQVEALDEPRMTYKGPTRWIGRRGAGGDLWLRRADEAPFHAAFESSTPGSQGTLWASYHRSGIPKNGQVTVTRELLLEPLPRPPESAPASVGTLRLHVVDEADRPLGAKVRIDRQGWKAPLFPDDGGLDGADRFAWTGNGAFERALLPGRYDLLATAGIERDAARATLDVREGATAELTLKLSRVIDSPGWIAGDLHLHQAPSVDSDISLENRVVAIAAEGVEFAVATDHYIVTDLAPTVAWLRREGVLVANLVTMAGSEVSTLGTRFGHFNVFPLRPGTNVKYENTTPAELFADARLQSPSGVLQVNHPRWDPKYGYFTAYGIDDTTGGMSRAGYDPDFDTIEVYNGDDAQDLKKKVRRPLLDWIHMLGNGRRYAATGSSDSHNLAFLDPGLPRTMIHHGSAASDADDLSATSEQIVAAIKAGRSFVSSGPFIEANIGQSGPGETASGVGKRAQLHVRIRAAPWIDVRTLEVLEGGRARRVVYEQIPRSKTVVRFDRTFDIPIKEKTFFVVVVQGDRPLPNASREFTFPFAFTNAIWVE